MREGALCKTQKRSGPLAIGKTIRMRELLDKINREKVCILRTLLIKRKRFWIKSPAVNKTEARGELWSVLFCFCQIKINHSLTPNTTHLLAGSQHIKSQNCQLLTFNGRFRWNKNV